MASDKSDTLYGATTYIVQEPNGARGIERIPPSTFDAFSASNAELSYFDLPDKPNDSTKLAEWSRFASELVKATRPEVCSSNLVSGISEYTGNWSGLENRPPTNQRYYEVIGAFDQTGFANSCAADAEESSWVGIGGDSVGTTDPNGDLLQDGTATYGSSDSVKAFYEFLGRTTVSEQFMTNISISPGDHFTVATIYTSANNGTTTFDFSDDSTGVAQQLSFENTSGDYWGGSIEWIDEAPTVS